MLQKDSNWFYPNICKWTHRTTFQIFLAHSLKKKCNLDQINALARTNWEFSFPVLFKRISFKQEKEGRKVMNIKWT